MKKEQVNNLIALLVAINEFSKDIHYTAHGEAFYAKHLLADKFNFDTDIIKECVLLGNDIRPLASIDYLKMACNQFLSAPLDNNDNANFMKLLDLINEALKLINGMIDLTKADENVIGTIAQDLQQYKGLINLQIEE